MKTTIALVASILAVVGAILIVQYKQKEQFDAAGLVFNRPPEWFRKQAYNPSDWLVAYYPDQLSKPECMHWRGNNKELNWLSSTNRFWRM